MPERYGALVIFFHGIFWVVLSGHTLPLAQNGEQNRKENFTLSSVASCNIAYKVVDIPRLNVQFCSHVFDYTDHFF